MTEFPTLQASVCGGWFPPVPAAVVSWTLPISLPTVCICACWSGTDIEFSLVRIRGS